jgi:hypothetical protein
VVTALELLAVAGRDGFCISGRYNCNFESSAAIFASFSRTSCSSLCTLVSKIWAAAPASAVRALGGRAARPDPDLVCVAQLADQRVALQQL